MQSSRLCEPVQKRALNSCGAPNEKCFNSSDTIFPLTAHERLKGRCPSQTRIGPALAGFVGPRNKKTIRKTTQKVKIMETSFSRSNRRVGFAFFLAVALGSCLITELRAQLVVVPNTLATNDANFSFTEEGSGVGRRMLIFDASQFGALSGPSFLTQFAWRPDQILGQSGPHLVNLRIYASTTTRSVAGLSMTFADNLGADNTLVFDGALTWTTANLPGPGNTRQFDIVFPLTTPFLYDPAAGNLLLDTQLSDNGQSQPITIDTVVGNPTAREIVNITSSTAATAEFVAPFVQVTQFTFVPEPTVAVSLLFGLGLLIAKRQRHGFSPDALRK